MSFQKCTSLSLQEKNSLGDLLKRLVEKKVITKKYADEGRKIFGIQKGGGSAKSGVSSNMPTSTPNVQMNPSETPQSVAQATLNGISMITRAQPQPNMMSSPTPGGSGGSSGGNNITNNDNRAVHSQVTNMQLTLAGIDRNMPPTQLALLSPDPAMRAWAMGMIQREAERRARIEEEERKEDRKEAREISKRQQNRMNDIVDSATRTQQTAMTVFQGEAAARNLILTNNINNKRIIGAVSGACFVSLASYAYNTLEPFEQLASALVGGLTNITAFESPAIPDPGWWGTQNITALLNFVMAIATRGCNGFVWAMGLLSRVFAGLVSMGHLSVISAILLLGCISTILIMRLYDANISVLAGPVYVSVSNDQQNLENVAPPTPLTNPDVLRDVIRDAQTNQPSSTQQRLLNSMPQQPFHSQLPNQVERLAVENGQLRARLQDAPPGQQPALRNQLNSNLGQQRHILQLPASPVTTTVAPAPPVTTTQPLLSTTTAAPKKKNGEEEAAKKNHIKKIKDMAKRSARLNEEKEKKKEKKERQKNI